MKTVRSHVLVVAALGGTTGQFSALDQYFDNYVCPQLFRLDAGSTECLVDVDTGAVTLVLLSDGLPDHFYDPLVDGSAPQSWRWDFPIHPKPHHSSYYAVVGGVSAGSRRLVEVGDVVGVAVNGVPFRMSPPPSANSQPPGSVHAADRCLGYVDPTTQGYYYSTAPPCLLPALRSLGSGLTRDNLSPNFDLLNHLEPFAVDASSFPSAVIGYALDGFPIYGPFDDRGKFHTGLDSCNGKLLREPPYYAYYATPDWPYLVGCFGPGEASATATDINEFSTNPGEEELEDLEYGGGSGNTLLGMRQGRESALPLSVALRDPQECPAGWVQRSVLLSGSNTGDGCVPCPPGTFATTATLGSLAATCDGLCPPGFYCEAGSSSPAKCPPGTYGGAHGLASADCSGACASGYFCPAGSTRADMHPCGGARWFCPPGSGDRTAVLPGWYTTLAGGRGKGGGDGGSAGASLSSSYPSAVAASNADLVASGNIASSFLRSGQALCEPGYWCHQGLRHDCPAGTYGAEPGLSTSACSGVCPKGTYCPDASVLPTKCPPGTYGGEEGLPSSSCSGLCVPGYYCGAGSTAATQTPCPAGQYGTNYGLKTSACSLSCDSGSVGGAAAFRGLSSSTSSSSSPRQGIILEGASDGSAACVPTRCAAGYFCPPGSSSPGQHMCGGTHVFCPEGSASPTPVQAGFYTVGRHLSLPGQYPQKGDELVRVSEVACEPGTWCHLGVRAACPAGTYGDVSRLTTAQCAGPAERGYYTPPESVSSRQESCGGAHAYCPGGEGAPRLVGVGNYSVGIPALRAGQNFTYASVRAAGVLSEAGGRGDWYTEAYDPMDDWHDRAGSRRFTGRHPVGPQEGSHWPGGDLTNLGASANRVAQAVCPPGAYCERGVARLCPAGQYGWAFGASEPACAGACGPGHWCPQGSIRRLENVCPAGRWSAGGSGSILCAGECVPGYFCPEGSASATEHACGGETVYCPPSSPLPINVTEGHYATGGSPRTRSGQEPCQSYAQSPPAGERRLRVCPSTTMPLAGPSAWYDVKVDANEYKRDVNDQGVEQ